MSENALESVLGSLEDQAESVADQPHHSSSETALVVSCSMSGSDHREVLWPIEPSWNVVDVPTLGNQTWDRYDGETVLDGNLTPFAAEYDLTAVLVVGHTTCDVVADAYDQCVAETESPTGIETRLGPLVSLVETASDEGVLDEATPLRAAQYRLVEYNVVRQVAFLRRALPESVTTVGYVHDQDGAYSSFPGKHYLVTLDGETAPSEIRPRLAEERSSQVASLLY